jgi:hypothetical protein
MKQLLIITLLSVSMIGVAQSKYFEQSLEWQASGNHNANSVLEDEHGNYVLVGSLKNVDIPVWRSCLIKTDNYGNLLDTVEYLPAPNHETVVWDLVIDTINHTYAMSGFINNYDIDPPNSDAYFLLTDTMGNILQETFINNSDTVVNCSYVLYRANDGGYMLAGFSWPNNPNYRRMPYMARLDAAGAYVWDSAYVDVSPGLYSFIAEGNNSKNGNYYVCGITNLTANYTKDGYLAEIDDTGTILWQKVYGEGNQTEEYIGGVLDSYEGGLALAAYSDSSVLPNPANEQISISPPSGGWGVQTHTFVLYDVLGKAVLQKALSPTTTQIPTEYLPSGIYLYQIINPQNQTLQHGKLSILH